MRIEEIELGKLETFGRVRSELNLIGLKQNIMKEGLLQPLIVFKTTKKEEVADTEGNFNEQEVYYIIDGVKRKFILEELGYRKAKCIVHDIPINDARKSRYFELVLNRVEKHYLDEIIAIFDEILNVTTLTVQEKEFILGLEEGDFVKLDEIIQYSRENPQYQDDVYSKLLKGKTSINAAHRRIAKMKEEGEIKEVPEGVELNDTEMEVEEYGNLKEVPVSPDMMNLLRVKYDNTCQVCSRKEPDLSNIFEAHKIIPDYINPDLAEEEDNLLLVCPTCRKAIRMLSIGRLHVNTETIYPKLVELSDRIIQSMKDTGRPTSVFIGIEQMRGLFD